MSGVEIKHEIVGRPDYAMIRMQVAANQTVLVEPSAMAAMDSNIQMKTKARGGLFSGVKRMFGGESFFMNEFTAEGGPGELNVSPALPGDLEHVALDGNTVILQGSGFVAASQGVQIDSKFQGLMRGLFNGEGFFFLKASGKGDLFFNTYGSMLQIPVNGDFVVDNGYIVAFDDTLDYTTEVVGGLKLGLTTFMSGEGIVCRFRGTGRVWIQSRQIAPYIGWAYRYAPRRKSN